MTKRLSTVILSEYDEVIIKYERFVKPTGEKCVRQYLQGKSLGRGGFAKVYHFSSLESHEVYAAKVIAKSTLKEEKYLQKFKTEVKVHQSLDHPNIVKFHRYFEDQENYYILLELCQNDTLLITPQQNLSHILHRRVRFIEPEVQYFLSQLIDALSYIHGQKILHRDLKLANLLLTDRLRLKVADFGLAAKLSSDSEKRKTTCGTANFMAPEVLNNIKGYSYPADIWSVGVICFNLLTGLLPFEATNSKDIARKIQIGKFAFPSSIPLSNTAKDFISKILVLDPSKRMTLDQIKKHAFLNPKNGIPTSLPTSTTVCAPPTSLFKEYLITEDLPKPVETPKPAEKKVIRPKSVEPQRMSQKTPVKQQPRPQIQAQPQQQQIIEPEKVIEKRTSTPSKKQSMGNIESVQGSMTNMTTDTRASNFHSKKQSILISHKVGNLESAQGSICNMTTDTKTSSMRVNTQGHLRHDSVTYNTVTEPMIEIKDSNTEKSRVIPFPVHVTTGIKMRSQTPQLNARRNTQQQVQQMESSRPRRAINTMMNDEPDPVLEFPRRNNGRNTPNRFDDDDKLIHKARVSTMMTLPPERPANEPTVGSDFEKAMLEKLRRDAMKEKIVVKNWPVLRILHWTDHTAGYGLGYTMSDGTVGILYNDKSKAIMDAKQQNFSYITLGAAKKEVAVKYSLRQFPPELRDKVMDLDQFNKNFTKKGQKATADMINKAAGEKQIYVKKWLNTKYAALFRMNNEDLHVIFVDNSMLVLSASGKRLQYINKKGEFRSFNLDVDSLSKDKGAKKRYTYALEAIEKVWTKKNTKEAIKKGEHLELGNIFPM